jgi:cytochrome c
MKNTIFCLIVILMTSIFSLTAYAEDEGKKLYIEKFCITCHGEKGISTAPNYPNLARQNPNYLVNQVKDIISGKRKNKLTILMTDNPVVLGVTDEELNLIADYLNKMQP